MNNEEINPDEFYTLPSSMNEVEELQDVFEILPSALNTIEIKIINKVKKPKFCYLPIEEPIKQKQEKISFNQKEFIADVKEQMRDLGVEPNELAKAIYVNHHRMQGILFKNAKPKPEEIKEIRKKLHLSI